MHPLQVVGRAALLLVSLLCLGICLQILVSGAYADDPWPRELPPSKLVHPVLNNDDLSISLYDCASYSSYEEPHLQRSPYVRMLQGGRLVNKLGGYVTQPGGGLRDVYPQPYCKSTSPGLFYNHVVGSDGSFYGPVQVQESIVGPSPGPHSFLAYKNNHALWDQASVCLFGEQNGTVTSATQGASGDIYAVVSDWNCDRPSRLVGIRAGLGTVKFSHELTDYSDDYPSMSNSASSIVAPYGSGLVVTSNLGEVRFFQEDGSEDRYFNFSLPSSSFVNDPHLITPQGTIYAWDISRPDVCLAPTGAPAHLVQYGMGMGMGRELTYSDGSCVLNDDILFGQYPRGIVILEKNTKQLSFFLNDFESSAWSVQLPGPSTGYVSEDPVQLGVDKNGKIVIANQALQSGGDGDRNITIWLVENDGNSITTQFDTSQYDNVGQYDEYSVTDQHLPLEAMGAGWFYFAVCRGSCTAGSIKRPLLFEVEVPGLDRPYTSIDLTKLQYVALGDSYSSGEGNPPYIRDLNTHSDECRRSEKAYPYLLDASERLQLNLMTFAACSGATVYNVRHGKSGEWGQLDLLSSATDVVTITVGGNDIDFANFATSCVEFTCDSSTAVYQSAMHVIDTTLVDDLTDLYGDILEKAPWAQLYVVAYPRMVPLGGDGEGEDGLYCPYLAGDDARSAYRVIAALNGAIRSAVAEVQNSSSRIHFVEEPMVGSWFEGYDICQSSNSYFNNVGFSDYKGWFHPNEEGHWAYRNMIASEIAP